MQGSGFRAQGAGRRVHRESLRQQRLAYHRARPPVLVDRRQQLCCGVRGCAVWDVGFRVSGSGFKV